MSNTNERSRVAVIGCGPCGMAILAAFSDAERKGEIIPEIVCFEKQASISGLWNYTWRAGIDEQGEAVHGSMYRYLWSNGPKECLEMANYTFNEHFKKIIPSFPPREVLQDYLLGRAKKYDVERFVKLNTVVRNVEQKGDRFLLTYEDLTINKREYSTFDYVVVATGHYSFPNFPNYPGLKEFPGRVLHSHDYRAAEEVKDKTVVVIGSSYSGEDLASQCYKYGSKEVYISYRSKPMDLKWPKSITEVPRMEKIEGNMVHFIDGTSCFADAIIFCTGYKHHFPFMTNDLRLHATNIVYPNHLYKGTILQGKERILYLGMQDQFYTFTMFDAQAWYARDYILGKIKLPSDEEREKDVKLWYDRGQKLTSAVEGIEFQRDFVKDLLKVKHK